MNDEIYSKQDSLEVRKTYYKSLKEHPEKENRRQIITDKEYTQLRKAGQDMAKFVTIETVRKAAIKEQREKMLEKALNKAHKDANR